jgi:uncharacterized membrane protein
MQTALRSKTVVARDRARRMVEAHPDRTGLAILAVVTAAAITGFSWVALEHWRNFETGAYDLGFFDQVIYNSSKGRIGETSFLRYNALGEHMDVLWLMYVPFYWMGASALVLTVSQALIAGVAAVPLYFAGRGFGATRRLALLFVAAYLLNPYMHRALDYDFHTVTLLPLPAFAALWAAATRRYWLAAVLALACLPFKEDAAFVTLTLAAVLWSVGGRRQAAVTAVLAVTWAAVILMVLMPELRHGVPSDIVDRYGYLYGSRDLAGLFKGALTDPWTLVQNVFAREVVGTFALFAVVSAPLAWARPRLFACVLPMAGISLLSDHHPQPELGLHYAASMIPIVFAASVAGSRALERRWPFEALACVALGTAAVGFLALSPFSPLNHGPAAPSAEHRAAVLDGLAVIPDGDEVSVSAQSGLFSRLSHRREIFEFPGNGEETDWVIVDANGYRSGPSNGPGFDRRIAQVRESYERVYDRDGVEVFRRR